MMKVRLISLFAVAAILSGCVYDNYTPERCLLEDNPLYLAFVLHSQGGSEGTRAAVGTLSKDAIAENLVSRLDIYFYDLDGNYLGHKYAPSSEEGLNSFIQDGKTGSDDQNGNIANRAGGFYVKLDSYRPAKMILAINLSSTVAEGFEKKSLQELRTLKQIKNKAWAGSEVTVKIPDSSTGGTEVKMGPFFMTSSTYLSNSGNEMCEVLIPSSYLMESGTAAIGRPLPVYVERLAAKVMVKAPAAREFRVPVVTGYPGITAKVKIYAWSLNALNRSAYYYKKVDRTWKFNWTGISWNEPARYRSHWSEDPNYTSATYYPHDFGNYKDSYKGTSVGYPGTALGWGDRVFEFVSWGTDFANPADNFTTSTAENPQYCLENTAEGSILMKAPLENQLYPRTTHVIVKSRISFSLGNGVTDDPDGYTDADQDYFRYNGVFYTMKGLVSTLLAESDAGGYYTDAGHATPVSEADFNIVHYYGEHVYLEPKTSVTIYNSSGENRSAEVKTFLKNKCMAIDGFKEGWFYYKIPVEHLTDGSKNTDTTYPTAQYGVVRNHNYVITIEDGIGGIGTGVWDALEPIVPETISGYNLSVYVTVSPWKQFEQKFVFLDPSGILVTDGHELDGYDIDWNENGWYF